MRRKTLITTFTVVWAILGCSSQEGIDAKYGVMSFQKTEKAVVDSVQINQMPTFYFHKNSEVIIKPDISFKFFNDTIFKYEFTPSSLKLKSKNNRANKFDIPIKRDGKDITLLLDNEYVTRITLVEID